MEINCGMFVVEYYYMRWVLVMSIAMTLVQAVSVDYYLVRHGARGPLTSSCPEIQLSIFGARSQMLTPPGRSQSFYYGRQLRTRHPLSSPQIFSTNVSRTKQTAEYFLKGWYGLEREGVSEGPAELVRFKADPKFLPPSKLSFRPEVVETVVGRNCYVDEIQRIPFVLGKKRPELAARLRKMWRSSRDIENNQKYTSEELSKIKSMQKSQLCTKISQFYPNICIPQYSPLSNFFSISDLLTCLQFSNATTNPTNPHHNIPHISPQQTSLAHSATNIIYSHRYADKTAPDMFVVNFFELLRMQRGLVVEFTHDVFIFEVVRALVGFKRMREEVFKGEMIMPFLTSLRFKVRRNGVLVECNDRVVRLPCRNYRCTLQQLDQIITKYINQQ